MFLKIITKLRGSVTGSRSMVKTPSAASIQFAKAMNLALGKNKPGTAARMPELSFILC